MGCFDSKDPVEREQKIVNQQLEKKLKTWNKDYMKAIKLLLLGAGESGKTTIIKQMKILHISGFSESDRQEKVVDIRQNIHESIYDLVTNMSALKPPVVFANDESEISASYICNLGPKEPSSYTQEYYDHVQTLWNDDGIKECYRRSNEFQLIDSAKYFLDRIKEVRNSEYRPSDQLFEGIHAILFLVASSDFDQTLREETGVNRLREAVNLFDDIWHSRFLRHAGVIVFLNKQDMLKEKIESGKSVASYFPEYNKYQMSSKDGDGSDEYIRTRCFIRDLFSDVTKKKPRSPEDRKSSILPGLVVMVADTENRQCYFHFTVATDTGNIKTVFEDVHSMILMRILTDWGLQ
ncbi:hypothetical protein Cfor_07468 [Coptotermes formosanus]|uniref:Guanine nucleotide-binding protein G(s) subunit alpha n=1 Tax=Coptotermes formosanus TaxID=36987 RepID=A0A6L2PDY1_COPFO|nr:hypothetical protein Cfor_07468 [Coptotermes formosanus]